MGAEPHPFDRMRLKGAVPTASSRVFGSVSSKAKSLRIRDRPLLELAWGLKLILPGRTAVLVSDPTLLLAVSSAVWFSASESGFDYPEGFRIRAPAFWPSSRV